MTAQVDFLKASVFLKDIIQENADDKELEWIHVQEAKLGGDFQHRSFYLAFSSASRFIRKASLHFSAGQLADAAALRKGFQPEGWNLLQLVRTYFLLMLPRDNPHRYEADLTLLHETADVEEQVSLYAALPVLPYPAVISKRAIEGIRTNITDVFDAIALNNPYPADFLDQQAWNQMLLKAVFMQRPLYRIYGADDRANPELASMLIDFAHERWAAGRNVIPELWRFVGPFLTTNSLQDIKKVLKGDSLEKRAGLLACAQSGLMEAQQLLDQYPEKKEIDQGVLHWDLLGQHYREVLKS